MIARLFRLVRKELREILRDRRTILTLVLMPLLLYPLIGIAFRQFLLSNLTSGTAPVYSIATTSEEDGKLIAHFLHLGDLAYAQQHAEKGKEVGAAKAAPEIKFQYPTREDEFDLEKAVRESAIHLGIRLPDRRRMNLQPDQELAADWELLYREDSVLGMDALAFVESRLAAANAAFLEERLRQLNVRQRAVPIRSLRTPLRDASSKSAVSLGALVPLVLILMTITGAVYPAIDSTAGERERGTLEILVAAPVPRTGLLFAKYVAVVFVAMLTALINLVAMTVSVQLTGIGPQLFGEKGLAVSTMLAVFGLLLLFAAFFSAVLLILTSFARSFKEAQAYLVPLILVSLVPGMLGLSGLPLSLPVAVLPLINIVLLARDLFDGTANLALAGVVVGSTCVYALLAITLAGRIFGAAAVLYGEGGGWWRPSARRKRSRVSRNSADPPASPRQGRD